MYIVEVEKKFALNLNFTNKLYDTNKYIAMNTTQLLYWINENKQIDQCINVRHLGPYDQLHLHSQELVLAYLAESLLPDLSDAVPWTQALPNPGALSNTKLGGVL